MADIFTVNQSHESRSAAMPEHEPDLSEYAPIVSLKGIVKTYGPTLANAGIELTIRPGEIIGLVGGNGAGKSTLMKILCGAVHCDSGEIALDGQAIDTSTYGPADAQKHGVRMVHQELSLCGNLSVAENFYLETPAGTGLLPGWRRRHRAQAAKMLASVFENSSIDANAEVGHLTIGERQMVEIARAAATSGVRLVVLDEPTSSLDQERSRQLRAYVRKQSAAGIAVIFISHKLQEVIDIATRIVVLRNGALAWTGKAADASIEKLVQLMGGDVEAIRAQGERRLATSGGTVIRISGALTEALGRDIEIRAGEVVGLAGLEGSGQKEVLHAIFAPRGYEITRSGRVGFIAGDRAKEGIFPLWNVLSNISIGRIASRQPLSFVSDEAEKRAALDPAAQLRLAESRLPSNILELSGGNQQKALVVRALVADAPILLLDDPTRGVDIATKQDFYRICNTIAAAGRTLVWLSTEDAELLTADRVLVFAGGKIVDELVGEDITEGAIVTASFAHHAKTGAAENAKAEKANRIGHVGRLAVNAAPFVSLAIVFAIMAIVNPAVVSVFGLDLLLMPALSLVLVAMAQMFVIGGSEIDLSVGAFAGLISVLSATLLYDQPLYGALAILAALVAYAGLGFLIEARKIPAIVVTLGASFIWIGVGYSLQPTPGGASPEWLSALVGWSIGDLPTSIIIILAVAVVAILIDRTPLGVTLRGFGANPAAMMKSGWKPTRYALIRYLISGLFAGTAGLSLTAINTASDINSGNSYTLLSVAAVVMGGSSLIGGIIAPAGVVAGAITLSLIGALLGVLDVSSDYNAATQGLLLIALLAFRSLVAESRSGS
jgi:ribose transport system ATP-binding protein